MYCFRRLFISLSFSWLAGGAFEKDGEPVDDFDRRLDWWDAGRNAGNGGEGVKLLDKLLDEVLDERFVVVLFVVVLSLALSLVLSLVLFLVEFTLEGVRNFCSKLKSSSLLEESFELVVFRLMLATLVRTFAIINK